MAGSNRKTCFVTIGATASFAGLIKAVLSREFFANLKSRGYTDLLVQYGRDGQNLYDSCLTVAKDTQRGNTLEVKGFALDTSGLQKHMLLAKGTSGGDREGVVISHAGSGTILDALRITVPLIVVPNEELLDNHQVELAEALAEQEYVVHGKLEQLSKALEDAEALKKKHRSWPPVNSGFHRPVKAGLNDVIYDELGYLD